MKDKYIQGIQGKIDKIDDLIAEGRKSLNFDSWKNSTVRLLEKISGEEGSFVRDFKSISYSPTVFVADGKSDYIRESSFQKGLEKAKKTLEDIINEINTYGLPESAQPMKEELGTNVTVNLNQTLNINISNLLENHLTVAQYNEVKDILKIENKENKNKLLTDFLINLGSTGLVEIVKTLLLGL